MPGVDQVAERPLQELVQTASQQAVLLAREQVDVARRELTARASQAGPGVAMVGGGTLLAALASGTGTAALILLLARRPGASAAALGVTGAYAGAGALLARGGLVRLRQALPPQPDAPDRDEAVENVKQNLGSAKQRTKSAAAKSLPLPDVPDQGEPRQKAKQALGAAKRRTKSAAKPPPQPTSSTKPKAKSPSSRRRASRKQTDRTGPPAS